MAASRFQHLKKENLYILLKILLILQALAHQEKPPPNYHKLFKNYLQIELIINISEFWEEAEHGCKFEEEQCEREK